MLIGAFQVVFPDILPSSFYYRPPALLTILV